jgi:hypothetical protein
VVPPCVVFDVVVVVGSAFWVAVKLPFVLLPPFAVDVEVCDVVSVTGPAAPPAAV